MLNLIYAATAGLRQDMPESWPTNERSADVSDVNMGKETLFQETQGTLFAR